MCAMKSLMSQVLLNTLVKVFFGTKTWGRLRPPPPPQRNNCLGGGGGLYSAAYEHKDCEQSLIFPFESL